MITTYDNTINTRSIQIDYNEDRLMPRLDTSRLFDFVNLGLQIFTEITILTLSTPLNLNEPKIVAEILETIYLSRLLGHLGFNF